MWDTWIITYYHVLQLTSTLAHSINNNLMVGFFFFFWVASLTYQILNDLAIYFNLAFRSPLQDLNTKPQLICDHILNKLCLITRCDGRL